MNAGFDSIYVTYTAGYNRWQVPEPLESACLELMSMLYNLAKKDPSLKSESIGEYKYTMADRLNALFSASGGTSVSNLIGLKILPFQRMKVVGA